MAEDFEVDLTGRRILVTGASRGIAAAIARAAGRAGASVIVNHARDIDAGLGHPDAAEDLARAIEAAGGRAELLEADLSQDGAAARVAARALAGGTVDGLVLSASLQIHAPFLEQTPATIARQVSLNLGANIALLQGLITAMVADGFGRVLSIGSVQEVTPSAEMPIYAMTKAAMRNLMENLAVQHGPDGVTFNTLSPGLVRTDRNAFRRTAAETWARAEASANPIGRAALPEEMAAPALYLLSRGAGFVTGATLYATGGSHIAAPRLAATGSPALDSAAE